MSLCVDDRLVWRLVWTKLHTRRSSKQSDIYQISHWYNWFSWWCARDFPKHVQNRNKYTWKGTVGQVGYLQRLYRDARSTKHKILPYASNIMYEFIVWIQEMLTSREVVNTKWVFEKRCREKYLEPKWRKQQDARQNWSSWIILIHNFSWKLLEWPTEGRWKGQTHSRHWRKN